MLPFLKLGKFSFRVIYNACFMDGSKPVTHLATSVWNLLNNKMKPPVPPVPKSAVSKGKRKAYSQIASDCHRAVQTARKKLAK